MKSRTKLLLIPVLAVAVAACSLMGIANLAKQANVSAEGEKTYVYFNDNWDWNTWGNGVYAYAWTDGAGSNAGWPGAKLNVENPETVTFAGASFYKIDVTGFEKIIFNNNNGTQSVDITITPNAYYKMNWVGGDANPNNVIYAVYDPADTAEYYFYAEWENVYVYSFYETAVGTDNALGNWPGTKLDPVEEASNWYKATVNKSAKFIFNIGSNANQTADLSYAEGNAYYYNDNWYATKAAAEEVIAEDQAAAAEAAVIAQAKAEMKEACTWYLIGKLNGADANWDYSTADYKCDKDKEKDSLEIDNHAEWYNVELKAGDLIKAVHGNDADREGGFDWKNGAYTLGVNTVDDQGNAVILYDGVYNLYLNADFNLYISRVDTEDLKLQATKHKTSSDGRYLLLVTGFELPLDTEGYSIGYFVDGEMYTTNIYYVGVNVATTDGGLIRFDACDLYGAVYSEYVLLVYELDAGEGNTWAGAHQVRAFVMYNGEIVDMGDVV